MMLDVVRRSLRTLFGRDYGGQKIVDRARYEEERKISKGGDEAARLALAQDEKTHREILYYLATHDPSPVVRQAVAKNRTTPVQVSPLLAADTDEDVRLAMARRLVALLPELDQDAHSRLYAFAVQALGTLALDEVLRIRKALSTTLKDYAHVPPKIANQLARDVEREVSAPILRFCTALSDGDLLNILKSHPESWAVQAIAARKTVSAAVSKAVIETNDRDAGVILLENDGAEIGEALLAEIVEKAKSFPEWQEPAALHKNLPPSLAEQLAAFADLAVRDILLARDDFDSVTVENIARVFKSRLEKMGEWARSEEPPAVMVARMAREGTLSASTITDAVAMREYDLAYAALACLAGAPIESVNRIFDAKAPKSIVALCWKAGLPMRLAYKLQQEPGQIQPASLIAPRGGTDYPLTEEEMRWQLDFLGLDAA